MDNSQRPPTIMDVRRKPVSGPTLFTNAPNEGAVLDQQPIEESSLASIQPTKRRPSWRRVGGLGLLAIGLVAGTFLVLHNIHANQQSSAMQFSQTGISSRIKVQEVALSSLSKQLSTANTELENSLTINGQVIVSNSLVLQPSSQPTAAIAGQIYYDQATNRLAYFNGTSFVGLQGGSNTTQITNNGVTNVTNTNITNTNTSIAGGSGGLSTAGGGTTGSIAMFTDSNTIGASLLTQTGTTLSTGTGIENVTIGSTNAASATTVQGGTTGLALLTGNITGNSGAITLQSGDSSTTAAGNITIDTGSSVISGTIVGSKDFENGTDNMGEGIYGNNSTITQTNAQAHSGAHSLAIAVGSNFFPSWSVSSNAPFQEIPVVQGHTYAFSAWVRAGSSSDTITASVNWSNDGFYGGGIISTQTYGTITDVSTGWHKVAGILTAPAGSFFVGFDFFSNDAQTVGEVHYLDDLTVTDLSSSTNSSSLNLGATNAQLINIGNSGQLGATSLVGSGVNIAAGAGILNLTGATLAATTGGATFTTTSGALDISSGTSATWKVGASGGIGGDLTIQAGNANTAGNNSGGNLILQGGTVGGTGSGGSVIVKPQTDSTNVFEVQNAAGTTTLLSVDTVNGVVSATAFVDTGDLTVNGHFISGGGTPGITAGSAACTTPTVAVNGTDTSGTITITTGSGCSGSGALATLTFAKVFTVAPHITLTPGGSTALGLGVYVDDATVSTTSFTIGTNTTPVNATTYRWNYQTIQ